jgi:hypothetical protein
VGDAQVATLPSGSSSPGGIRQLPPLGGLAFFAPSVQAAFYGQISIQYVTYTPASPGYELLYLSVNACSFAPRSARPGTTTRSPQLSVTFAGHSVALPETPDGTISGVAVSAYGDDGACYPGSWVVAVPKGIPVRLVAAQAGFSQSLDMGSGTRVGSAPTVLYRSRSGPLTLDLRPNLAGSLVVNAGGNRVTFPVTLQEAALSFFDLASPDPTASRAATQAYLFDDVSVGTGTDQDGRADWYLDPQVATQGVNFQVAGKTVAATEGPPAADPGDTGEPFSGLFGHCQPEPPAADGRAFIWPLVLRRSKPFGLGLPSTPGWCIMALAGSNRGYEGDLVERALAIIDEETRIWKLTREERQLRASATEADGPDGTTAEATR